MSAQSALLSTSSLSVSTSGSSAVCMMSLYHHGKYENPVFTQIGTCAVSFKKLSIKTMFFFFFPTHGIHEIFIAHSPTTSDVKYQNSKEQEKQRSLYSSLLHRTQQNLGKERVHDICVRVEWSLFLTKEGDTMS